MKFDFDRVHLAGLVLVISCFFFIGVVVGSLFPAPGRELNLGKKVLAMPLGSYLGRGIDYTDNWNYTTTDLNSDYTTLTVGTGKTPEEAIDSAKPMEY